MNLKDIIGEGDSATAVMFWADLYINRLCLTAMQTSNWLRRGHNIDATVTITEDPFGSLVEIQWGGKNMAIHTHSLTEIAEKKYARCLMEYSEQHGGILNLPDRLCVRRVEPT